MNSSISKLSKTLIVTPIIATAVLTFVPTLSAFAATQTPNNYLCEFKTYTYTYWTPVLLLNSPYGGNSSASSSVSYTGEYSVGGFSSSTAKVTTAEIDEANGAAGGLFQLDNWTYYRTTIGDCPNEVVITSTTNELKTWTLLPPGSTSDTGEVSSFEYDGYSSITFNNDYTTNNDGCINTVGGPGYQATIATASTTSVSVSISFPGASYIASGNLDISISSGSSNTVSFTCNFPSNCGIWYWDSLNGQSGSSQGALAFEYVS
ncbi:MAG: hypothetical protein JRN19_06890 [Nitrososphaerota archaeon]|jgi:hypothetical protein|nr:hypothetical protein [Nitrososphaerota archaeon]MDG7052155.1 hypothetical protein [Nitrososphaerota archaeon]